MASLKDHMIKAHGNEGTPGAIYRLNETIGMTANILTRPRAS
jgi:hypothetical protein